MTELFYLAPDSSCTLEANLSKLDLIDITAKSGKGHKIKKWGGKIRVNGDYKLVAFGKVVYDLYKQALADGITEDNVICWELTRRGYGLRTSFELTPIVNILED